MKSKGFALMTVLVIVIIVPIVVFGITFFITSSITRYDTQTRSMKALYLAEAGIHRAVFNLQSTGAALPVSDWDAHNQIDLEELASGCDIYQLKCTGTSVSSGNSLTRTVFAQYELPTNKIQIYMEGDGTGIPPPPVGGGNLVYNWAMNENGGTTTGSGIYQGDLIPTRGVYPAWVAGKVGLSALRFNFNNRHNYVNIPDSAGLDLTTAGTIMAWVRWDSVDKNSGFIHKGALSNAKDEAYGLILDGSSSLGLELRTTSGLETLQSAFVPVAGTWYHIAGVWDTSGMRLYVDGALAASNTTAVTVQVTDGPLQLGTKYGSNASKKFRGTLDEVHLYDGSICPSDILAYYNSTK